MPAAATCISASQHDAPLDPNFSGEGRVMTDEDGRYQFMTISPELIRGEITTMPGVRPTFTFLCLVRRL